MKHKNTQPLYIFNGENPQNSEPQNGPRSGLYYIALAVNVEKSRVIKYMTQTITKIYNYMHHKDILLLLNVF